MPPWTSAIKSPTKMKIHIISWRVYPSRSLARNTSVNSMPANAVWYRKNNRLVPETPLGRLWPESSRTGLNDRA